MLYKIEHDKSIIDTNPELKSIKEFDNCTDRQLKWVFLTYDYKTPYKGMKFEERKLKVAMDVGYKYEKGERRLDKNARNLLNGNTGTVQAAIKQFMEMQWDEDRETLNAYDQQLEELRSFLKEKDKNHAAIKTAISVMKELVGLQKLRRDLMESLGLQADITIEEVDDTTLSKSVLDQVNAEEMGYTSNDE